MGDDDSMYLVFMLPSPSEARSLAKYFAMHGIDSGTDAFNEVSCHLESPEQAVEIVTIRKLWPKFWQHELETAGA